jgi:hypothetical protein
LKLQNFLHDLNQDLDAKFKEILKSLKNTHKNNVKEKKNLEFLKKEQAVEIENARKDL